MKTDRIAVPEKAGTVDPLDHLTGDRAAVFSNMECLRRAELKKLGARSFRRAIKSVQQTSQD